MKNLNNFQSVPNHLSTSVKQGGSMQKPEIQFFDFNEALIQHFKCMLKKQVMETLLPLRNIWMS